MSARVYVLMDIVQGESDQVVRKLQGKPGVLMADPLEGGWDLILVVEAGSRERLAELTIQAIAPVEDVTEGMRVLPTRDGVGTHIGG